MTPIFPVVGSDLAAEGYLEVSKEGRRNHYRVGTELPLRHPVEAGLTLDALVALATRGSP